MAAAPISTAVEMRPGHAKRSRVEVADPPDALSGTPAAHPNNWRDWANLTDGPAGMIAEEVLADDVAGYLRFRSVCGSWRRCTPSPTAHDVLERRFHPRGWIMLPEVEADHWVKELQGFSAGLADNSTVALHFDDHDRDLAVAKRNDKRWSRRVRPYSIMESLNSITATASFANRFYCVTRNGFKAVDVSDAGQRPQLVAVKVDQDFWSQRGVVNVNLVDNDSELILLRTSWRDTIEPPYDVQRVDLDAGKMVPMRGLRGRAIFVCDNGAGSGRSLSVHAGLSSSITADAIYRCRSDSYGMVDDRPEIDLFLVPDGRWIEHDLLVSPGSIIDYLSRFVCRSQDIVVPAPLHRSVEAADALHRSIRAAADGPRKQMKRERKANPKLIGNEWVN
ncbi:hypothetical protein ACQ4PT_052430 [Festuca glaucescens]